MCPFADHRGLQNRVAALFVVILRKVTDQRHRNEVQHDRVDDLVRSKSRFQNARNRPPKGATEYRGEEAERNEQPWAEICELNSNPCCRERGDVELTFGADVE